MATPEGIQRSRSKEARFRHRLHSANDLDSLQQLKLDLLAEKQAIESQLASFGIELSFEDVRFSSLIAASRVRGLQIQEVQTKMSGLRRGNVDPYRFMETARKLLPKEMFDQVATTAREER